MTMTETLKTPEPSKEALLACAWSGDNLGVLRAAYEIDVAPLIAERDRLAAENARLVRENAALHEVLGTLVNNKSADWFSDTGVSGLLGLKFAHCRDEDGPSFRARDILRGRAVLAQFDAPPTDGRLAQAESAIAEAVEIMRPFAESSANYDGYLAEEDCDNAGVLTVASLRAAHAFVEKHGAPTNGGEE
jgi:hypothetical protein